MKTPYSRAPGSAVTASSLRQENSRLILQTIRRHQPVSRAHLASRAHMSLATVTRVVNGLIDEGIVEETGVVNTDRGRKPVMLQFNSQSRAIGAVRFDVDQTVVALVNLSGQIMARRAIPVEPGTAAETTFRQVKAVFDDICAEDESAQQQMLGYGFTVPGFVRNDKGFVDVSVVFGWQPGKVKGALESVFGPKVSIDGLVEVRARAEYYFGGHNLTPDDSALFLFVDEGVGAVLMNGIGQLPQLRYEPVVVDQKTARSLFRTLVDGGG